jgi:hypothetical protein
MGTRGSSRWLWPLWGVAAGAFGMVGTLLTDSNPTGDKKMSAEEVVAALDRDMMHIGIVAGLIAVFCLLVFAAGWRRWANEVADSSLAASVISMAITAGAGALLLGYGFKGALAVYLPGGMDEEMHTVQGLYSLFMFIDFGPYIGWWGIAMAAIAVAWLALAERKLPIWTGLIGAFFALVPIGFVVVTGLPGFPGVIDPLWLIVTGIGLAVTFRRQETVRGPAPLGTLTTESGSLVS